MSSMEGGQYPKRRLACFQRRFRRFREALAASREQALLDFQQRHVGLAADQAQQTIAMRREDSPA
jgi:hypothetical protein